jgi:hypothetical protein
VVDVQSGLSLTPHQDTKKKTNNEKYSKKFIGTIQIVEEVVTTYFTVTSKVKLKIFTFESIKVTYDLL